MPSIFDWSTIPGNNQTSDGAINWQENQDPATVNNSARQMMGRQAEWLCDLASVNSSNTNVQTTGTGTAYVLSTVSPWTVWRPGISLGCTFHATNAASPTLAVNGTSAYPLLNRDGSSVVAGQIRAGSFALLVSAVVGGVSSWVILTHGISGGTANGGYTGIASAATVDLSTIPTLCASVSGTVPITSFGTGANLFRMVYAQSNGLVITYNATSLILPGAANITMNAGDHLGLISDASGNWHTIFFLRAAGRPMNTGATDTVGAGFTATTYNNGPVSSGTASFNPQNGNYQTYTNNGAHTINPSVAGGAGDAYGLEILVVNGATAGAITFSGFVVGANTGDALDTVNGHQFLLMIRRIFGIATYMIKALQ